MDRREFFKLVGVAAAATGAASAGITGYLNAIDPAAKTGWEKEAYDPEKGRFDRTPFEIDHMPFNKVGTPKRVEKYADTMLRRTNLSRAFDVPEGMPFEDYLKTAVDVNDLTKTPLSILKDKDLVAFYQGVLDREGWNFFVEDLRYFLEVMPFYKRINMEASFDIALASAYVNAHMYSQGLHVSRVAAKDSDFQGVSEKRYEIKDPKEMSRLIKKIGALFGSPLVRIVKLNPEWSYEHAPGDGRGYKYGEPVDIPEHWQYGIIMGIPLSWETREGAPSFFHTFEGYGNASMHCARMAEFVKKLGYPARENSPHARYEYIMPPHMVAAGIGEQGRLGVVVTPEFGPNFRPSMVVTNMPLEPDKPIDVGIRKFCMNCKICADQCPSGSISFDGPKEINGRGYDGWQINASTCHNFWMSVPNGGCRVCLAVCPFSKESNWLHTTARDIAVRDRTGITASTLTWMEKAFYGVNTPEHYHYKEGTRQFDYLVGEKPWFFESKDFLKEN
ncbi:reductive dehalogenase [Desulfitobacterium sp. LBE]|uniref:reductive dehalogenase n=1 Tax=Desulfitobacterium sp. LBE TaxID=884086 RepID=UPI001198FE59|nr:reductive dehalogenase [Desulfitobacterium sp. LBE]TWH56525.1 reductive dehalogenase [Desulfitobacterium sp. LBE]